jgi:hypothetical protein
MATEADELKKPVDIALLGYLWIEANACERTFSGHPLRLSFSATAMVGCSMNIRLPHRDGTMVNGALGRFVAVSMAYEQQVAQRELSKGTAR